MLNPYRQLKHTFLCSVMHELEALSTVWDTVDLPSTHYHNMSLSLRKRRVHHKKNKYLNRSVETAEITTAEELCHYTIYEPAVHLTEKGTRLRLCMLHLYLFKIVIAHEEKRLR
jgi:hypothetical protein